MSNNVGLIGVVEDWKVDEEGNTYRVYGQEFDTSYWAGLQWHREQDAARRCADLWQVADVPAVFVEKWLKQGFNIYVEPAKAVVKRLKEEGLTDFLTTSKRVY